MRISSELFPFASHDKYGYDLDYAATELKVRTRQWSRHEQRLTATCRRLLVILRINTTIE
jgi:UV DNA damage endonuclease